MKISKSEIKYLIQIILIWIYINFAANLFGLWLTKLLNVADYVYPENILNEFVAPILFQGILFGICITIAFMFMKKKGLAYYVFVAFQFLIFHIILILNLAIHNGLHFISSFDDIGLKYLSYCGQYLIDILYLYFPIGGNFENGKFLTDDVGNFYLHWILLVLVYYFVITWLSVKTVKFLFRKGVDKTAVQSESNDSDL